MPPPTLFCLLLHQALQNLPGLLLHLSPPFHQLIPDHPKTGDASFIYVSSVNLVSIKVSETCKSVTLAPANPSPGGPLGPVIP